MRIDVDKDRNALLFWFDASKIVESEEVRPGVILDFDEKNQVVGVELLGIPKQATKENLTSLQFRTV